MPKIYVAHYGHPLLKGAKHWALLIPEANNRDYTAYQVTGSTDTYEVKPPELVRPEISKSYMGKVEVGEINANQQEQFATVTLNVPIVRGNTHWNCQNWVIEVLKTMKENGFQVTAYSLEELQAMLAATLP
ncbi:hypothetical protein NEOLEDRAFT_1061803 [Neolentinus lepideus HHB14362 ss-1]|uniref:Uncharacterized protein n=1 Tax=Neolentinus lepideus HHB14362 ss-1 TaxID=1314782 RepID=A0A165TQY2_9AGAM|nr:hypothetical protein NEOLEDRAFT_1061803 [Neolentinus lepideus HHB14362 ss-1]